MLAYFNQAIRLMGFQPSGKRVTLKDFVDRVRFHQPHNTKQKQ